MVPPFRAFVGIAIILVSFVYMGYREIALGKRLGPVNAILRSAADEVEEVIADTLVSRQLVQNPLVRRIPVGSDRDRMSLSPHGHDHIVVLDTHERQGRRNTDVLEGNTKIARFA